MIWPFHDGMSHISWWYDTSWWDITPFDGILHMWMMILHLSMRRHTFWGIIGHLVMKRCNISLLEPLHFIFDWVVHLMKSFMPHMWPLACIDEQFFIRALLLHLGGIVGGLCDPSTHVSCIFYVYWPYLYGLWDINELFYVFRDYNRWEWCLISRINKRSTSHL